MDENLDKAMVVKKVAQKETNSEVGWVDLMEYVKAVLLVESLVA